MEESTQEHDFGWVFFYQANKFIESAILGRCMLVMALSF